MAKIWLRWSQLTNLVKTIALTAVVFIYVQLWYTSFRKDVKESMSKEIDIEYYHQLALQKQKEHRKFLGNLKKKAPKNLDKIALEIHQEVFEEIDCTACANCCKSLGPDFKEADITRIAKYFKMKLPAFEDEFLQVDEDGDKVFKSMPCPFLGGDNLCSIYDVRPKACREFPHTDRKKIYQINNLTIKNTLTCPAAYLFVEKLREKNRVNLLFYNKFYP